RPAGEGHDRGCLASIAGGVDQPAALAIRNERHVARADEHSLVRLVERVGDAGGGVSRLGRLAVPELDAGDVRGLVTRLRDQRQSRAGRPERRRRVRRQRSSREHPGGLGATHPASRAACQDGTHHGWLSCHALPVGTFISVGRSLDSAVERVRLAERLGYHSAYTTHIAGRTSLTVLAAYAAATERHTLSTDKLQTNPPHPHAKATAA